MKATQVILCAISFACLVLARPSVGGAQLPPTEKHLYIRTDDCVKCHSEPFERDKAAGTTDRVRLLEWAIWKDQDKHSWAHRVLHEERGQRIGELMGQDVLATSTGCVQCHTSNVNEQLWSPAILKDNRQNYYMAEGVSCQTCHGPAELWVLEHQKENWPGLNRDKKASLGLYNMENPVQRAEMCLSCHQGNAKLGRVITHEMYAAGHPMLSGFEMEGFADKMPRHWRFSHEKPNGGLPKFDRTRAVLLGSVVALRMAVAQAAGEGNNWPELARLECYSCHHQLRTPTWRQAPDRVEPPGRPRLQLGCLPLVRAAAVFVHGSAGKDQFADLVRRTQQPFQHHAFGDPAELAALRQSVSRWCADMEQKLQSQPLDVEQARAVLRRLITTAAAEAYDFDTSRQLSGAMAVICEELSQASIDMPNLATLRGQLNKIRYNVFELSPQEEQRVEQRYSVVLSRRAKYKPEKFMQLMVRFRDQLRE